MKISKKKTRLLLIFIISFIIFIGFIIIYNSLSLGTIYFNNGYEESFDVYIDGEKIGEVKSKDFLKVEDIKNGKYDIEIKKDSKLIETEEVNRDCVIFSVKLFFENLIYLRFFSTPFFLYAIIY